jgi:MFS family permease
MFSDGEDDDVLILELGGERIVMPKFREEDDDQDADDEATTSSSSVVVMSPELAVERVGVGPFQRRLTALCTLGNAADAVEVMSVALILPAAGADLGMTDAQKSALASAVFLGAFFGALLGGVLGDARGRRLALALAMAINALFALLSAAAPDATTLILCRFLAGVGVGGANAAVFSVVPEFLPRASRGKHAVVLASGWMFGSVYAASAGWATIPTLGWRTFLVASALPSIACLAGVAAFMPESPRFLASVGRGKDAAAVLRRVASANGTAREIPDGLIVRAKASGVVSGGVVSGGGAKRGHREALSSFASLCRDPTLSRRTLLVGAVWFFVSFGWYGLMLWLPEYFDRRLSADDDDDGSSVADDRVYAFALLVALANLPGNVASAFAVDVVGRRTTVAWCSATASLAAAAFAVVGGGGVSGWGGYVACACVFNALSVGGWNALDLWSAEAFPTATRSTAMGALGAIGRVGSLVGTSACGAAIGVSLTAPAWIACVAMVMGSAGAMATNLETRGRALEDVVGEEGGGGGEGEDDSEELLADVEQRS